MKDKQNPYYAFKYERIAICRGKKRAIIAIARMILTAIYSMLSTGEIWNPVDLFKIDMPEHLKELQLQKAMKQAVQFLEAQGLTASDILRFALKISRFSGLGFCALLRCASYP